MSIAGSRKLKTFLLVFSLIIAVAAVTYASSAKTLRGAPAAVVPARTLPVINFYDEAGKKTTVDDFKGSVTLVHLWATWCPPCIAEMPKLDALQKQLKDKGFRIAAISLDNDSIQIPQKFLKKNRIAHLRLYWDKDRQVPLKWAYEGLPTSYLLDKNGTILRQYNGETPELKDMLSALQAN